MLIPKEIPGIGKFWWLNILVVGDFGVGIFGGSKSWWLGILVLEDFGGWQLRCLEIVVGILEDRRE